MSRYTYFYVIVNGATNFYVLSILSDWEMAGLINYILFYINYLSECLLSLLIGSIFQYFPSLLLLMLLIFDFCRLVS